MSRYIKSFENDAAIQSAVDNGVLSKPYVAYDESAHTIDWNSKYYDPQKDYLTFVIQSNGEIIFSADGNINRRTAYYSKNGGEWTRIDSAVGESAPKISVVSGDVIKWRATGLSYAFYFGGNTFTSTCNFIAQGNVMSLLYGSAFTTETDLVGKNSFNGLFRGCTGLTDASQLILPATTLTQGCYREMFNGCTSLTKTPELPATTLANGCYWSMFNGCTGLTQAPALPATTLAQSCYQNMFSSCSSLTTAPELPATSLVKYCYFYLFNSCSNLNYIKCLATDISANSCTTSWVSGVSSSGTFVKNPAMSSWTTGINGIPANWTIEDA